MFKNVFTEHKNSEEIGLLWVLKLKSKTNLAKNTEIGGFNFWLYETFEDNRNSIDNCNENKNNINIAE